MDRFEHLHVYFDSNSMGIVRWNRDKDRLEFEYEESWRSNAKSFPLSLSMPLDAATHGHETVKAFLWGLLPDNDTILERWGQRFGVSPRNPFRLLSHVGEECAGAAQFIRPERLSQIEADYQGDVNWLSEAELEERLAELVNDHSIGRYASDEGQFSLAGAQAKTALHYDPKGKRWGIPAGKIPTTHIFKPATGTFEGHAENEHFCLRLASQCGMPAAKSELIKIGDTTVFVTQRYDRILRNGRYHRIHQEDTCQALARFPQTKYQNQGGPSATEVIELLRASSSRFEEDILRFTDSLIFNWIISGTDAHAKNYSTLLAGAGQARLAPIYDLASSLPYPRQIDPHKAKMAMKIGGNYKVKEIGRYSWEKQAREMRIKPDRLWERIKHMIESVPDFAHTTANSMQEDGLPHSIIAELSDAISHRCLRLKNAMA